jgi:putative ABC transport system ATP-binding protein
MDIFQRLNVARGITVLLITHEHDIAEYGTRLVRFRDGRIQVDQPITQRRDAKQELAALPPPEPEDEADVPSDAVVAEHGGAA